MTEINAAMLAHLKKQGRAGAVELAALTGITVSSARYHLCQLMGAGIVRREKIGNHRVWFFLNQEGREYEKKRERGGG